MAKLSIVLLVCIVGAFVGQVLVHEVWQTWFLGGITGLVAAEILN